MENFSAKVADFFVQEGSIEKEEAEIFRYGLEILLDNIGTMALLMLIGGIVDRILETSIYLLVFCSLRQFTGGYHAKTRRGCHMATIVGYLLFLIEMWLLTGKQIAYRNMLFIMGMAYVICFGVILVFAPVEHKNKPLTEMKKRKNRRYALGEMLLLGGGIAILYSSLPEVSFAILVTLIEVALLIIIGRKR